MTLENNAKTILKGSSIRSGTIAPQTATSLGTWHAERRLRQFPPSPVLFRLEHNDLSKMTKGSSRVPCALSTTIWLTIRFPNHFVSICFSSHFGKFSACRSRGVYISVFLAVPTREKSYAGPRINRGKSYAGPRINPGTTLKQKNL